MTHASPCAPPRVALTTDLDYSTVIEARFRAAAATPDYAHVAHKRLRLADDVSLSALDEHGLTVLSSSVDSDGEQEVLCDHTGALVALKGYRGRWATLSVAAATAEHAGNVARTLRDALHDDSSEPNEQEAPVYIWHSAGRSANVTKRTVDADAWETIAGNYQAAISGELERVLALGGPHPGGLALWYGPPGTGKTTAVRALARAWRSWCDVHVIVDPETLLTTPSYLIQVLTHETCSCDNPTCPQRGRSRLVVLEDAGELIAADARAATGQALSRVLNAADGLLGRGLNSSVLITTNEEIGRLHPAIRRPGRCWMQLRFDALAPAEANAWLAANDVDVTVATPHTLAELFALQRGETLRHKTERPFGFVLAAGAR